MGTWNGSFGWYKSACITEYVYGATYAMELIAVHVSKSTIVTYPQIYCEIFHLIAFWKFLEAIESFDDVDIIFEDAYRLINGHEPCENRKAPSILDPVNPYNNLADGFMKSQSRSKHLKCMPRRLWRTSVKRGIIISKFTGHFWRMIPICIPEISFHHTCQVLIGFCDRKTWELKHSAAIIFHVKVNDVFRKKIEFMQILQIAIGNYTRDRLTKIYTLINPTVELKPALGGKHKDRDVTICLKNDHSVAALYSFNIPVLKIECFENQVNQSYPSVRY